MILLIGVCMAITAPCVGESVEPLQIEIPSVSESVKIENPSVSESVKIENPSLEAARELVAARDPATWFITKEGKPTERLVELLKLDELYDSNDGLPELVAKTQKAWVQTIQGQGGKERTDLEDSAKQAEIRIAAERIAQEIGLLEARPPLLKKYDYGICYGSFLDGVRNRVAELVDSWKSGVRFDSLVFLSGERTLRKDEGQKDTVALLTDEAQSPLKFKEGWKLEENTPYETEYDLCKIVWEQSEIPEDMAVALEGKVVFVNAPRPDSMPRPGTKDTYYAWLKVNNPTPGTILAFSYPVLWSYQDLAAQNCLGEKFVLDTCTVAPSPQLLEANQVRIVSIVQDTVAKCLYELAQRPSDVKEQG